MFGPQRSLFARLLPWVVAIVILALFGGASLWVRQQEGQRRQESTRADAAEVELAIVRATLTAVVQAQATSQASAVALASQPGPSLERALGLVFAAYQEPTQARLLALNDAFAPAARAVFQTQAEHLISSGRHLGGDSTFQVEVLTTEPRGERADVRTRERWLYDERDPANQRQRCLIEEGEQTYTLRRMPAGWIVEDVQLGISRRSEC